MTIIYDTSPEELTDDYVRKYLTDTGGADEEVCTLLAHPGWLSTGRLIKEEKESLQACTRQDMYEIFKHSAGTFFRKHPDCIMTGTQTTWRGTGSGVRMVSSWDDVVRSFPRGDYEVSVHDDAGSLVVHETDHDGGMTVEIRVLRPGTTFSRDTDICTVYALSVKADWFGTTGGGHEAV